MTIAEQLTRPRTALTRLGILRLTVCALISSACLWPASPEFLNERHVYVRGEHAALRIRVTAPVARVAIDTSGWLPETVTVRNGGAVYELDTGMLRAGEYEVRAQPAGVAHPTGDIAVFPLTVAAERNSQRFPMWNWHHGLSPDLRWWASRGFTGLSAEGLPEDWSAAPEGARKLAAVFEEGTRLGLDLGVHLSPLGSPALTPNASLHALSPDGRRDPRLLYPREPLVLEQARKIAESVVRRFADYPSFRQTLLESEYQKPLAPRVVPQHLRNQEGHPQALPADWQPADGVLPDDNPIYRVLKWWWTRGHGTNMMNLEMSRVLKGVRPDMMTWHDPYRLAPVYHSHTGLDFVSTWTYGNPDILRLLYTTVLQAAAKAEHQKVMQTITLWVYGHFVVPMGKGAPNIPDLLPDPYHNDPFFVQGPDYTREAMWLVMSQRPDVLAFFHPIKLSPNDATLDPYLASPESFDAIGDVSRTLVEPYGPAILQCRRFQPRVAVLMSASSMWFPRGDSASGAHESSWTNESILPFCTLLARAHVPFDVVLDDDIQDGKLAGYDVLVISPGDTLLRSVYDRICEFARAGKKVIADGTLRARIPGVAMTGFDFHFQRNLSGNAWTAGHAITAEQYRARMEEYTERLVPLLAGAPRPAESDSQRVVVNGLESDQLRYVFLINDDKTYGPRFGEWKLMQESGVRQTTKFRIPAEGTPALYNALARAPVHYARNGGNAEFSLSLAPARGALIAVLPEPIGKVEVTTSGECQRGKRCSVVARVLGASGRAMEGTVPLRLEVCDTEGRKTEYCRFVATTRDSSGNDYRYTLSMLPALNDLPGKWQIRVTELLGGTEAASALEVK